MLQQVDNANRAPQHKRRRWRQFRLRTLLIAMTLASIGLCMLVRVVQNARAQEQAVAAIGAAQGYAYYSYEFDAKGKRCDFLQPPWARPKPWAPEWLQKAIGRNYFVTAVEVCFEDDPHFVNYKATDAALVHLKRMPGLTAVTAALGQFTDKGLDAIGELTQLTRLTIGSPHFTDAGVKQLTGLGRLRSLSIVGGQLSNESIAALAPLQRLEVLRLCGGEMTDAGLDSLENLPRLRCLYLLGGDNEFIPSAQFTGDCLAHLERCAQLEAISLTDIKLNDAQLDRLGRMGQLKCVSISNAGVTRADMQKLQEALPHAVLRAKDYVDLIYSSTDDGNFDPVWLDYD